MIAGSKGKEQFWRPLPSISTRCSDQLPLLAMLTSLNWIHFHVYVGACSAIV